MFSTMLNSFLDRVFFILVQFDGNCCLVLRIKGFARKLEFSGAD